MLADHQRMNHLYYLIRDAGTNAKIDVALSLRSPEMQKHALQLLLFYPSGLSARETIDHLNYTSYAGSWTNRDLSKTLEITTRLMSEARDPEWLWNCIKVCCKNRYHYMALDAMMKAKIAPQLIL